MNKALMLDIQTEVHDALFLVVIIFFFLNEFLIAGKYNASTIFVIKIKRDNLLHAFYLLNFN